MVKNAFNEDGIYYEFFDYLSENDTVHTQYV